MANTLMFTSHNNFWSGSSPESLSTHAFTMEWSWIIFFLTAIATGKWFHSSRLEEGPHTQLTVTPLCLCLHRFPLSGQSTVIWCWAFEAWYLGELALQAFWQYFTHYTHCVNQWPGQSLKWFGRVHLGNGIIFYEQNFQGKATLIVGISSRIAYIELSSLTSVDSVIS